MKTATRTTCARSTRTLKGQVAITALVLLFSGACSPSRSTTASGAILRLGYLNNITHTQALVSIAHDNSLARDSGIASIEMRAFNAGPALLEAMMAGELDAGYVGPTGVINTHFRTRGNMLRIVAGAASGGARLMLKPGLDIRSPQDFSGLTIATPGIGNTQDIALRSWLSKNGLAPREKGGTVSIRPISNPDIYQLMRRGHLHAAWVPEPWASRLELDIGAQTFLDERMLWPDGAFATVLLTVRQSYLREHPDAVGNLVRAHQKLTRWIQDDREAAIGAANSGLERSLGTHLPPKVVRQAFSYFSTTTDPLTDTIKSMARDMLLLGYLPPQSDLDDLDTVLNLANLEITGIAR